MRRPSLKKTGFDNGKGRVLQNIPGSAFVVYYTTPSPLLPVYLASRVWIKNISAAPALPPSDLPPQMSSLCGRRPARIPVRGVINTPVLRLRPFAALVPLRDYPSGSVPFTEPCRAAARIRDKGAGRTEPGSEGRRQGHRRRHSLFLPAPVYSYTISLMHA